MQGRREEGGSKGVFILEKKLVQRVFVFVSVSVFVFTHLVVCCFSLFVCQLLPDCAGVNFPFVVVVAVVFRRF